VTAAFISFFSRLTSLTVITIAIEICHNADSKHYLSLQWCNSWSYATAWSR